VETTDDSTCSVLVPTYRCTLYCSKDFILSSKTIINQFDEKEQIKFKVKKYMPYKDTDEGCLVSDQTTRKNRFTVLRS
jgi:hypothetical protein